ncbi:MAG: DUF4281 domain-containing protein [Candidatus Pelagibacterales bacterium]|nr:MAG: DUF4281 domain-containing protein [Pelagibacteraceae bacterium TMED233]RZO61529.1 MAG: DUF4281 domain-containing protein [Pelagibacterales bacterium]|tara:strand:+ start:2269 stop:2742 length:474 start_codon:yes stop_codon:yes gene_type:complete
MLTEIYNFFTIEMIYLWINYGVLPMWLALIFFPNSKLNQIFITSVFLPLVFASLYSYIVYQLINMDEDIFNSFSLYLGLNELKDLFSNEFFLLLFWIHFISINLFLGSWVSRDGLKFGIPKFLTGICLVFIYFVGPIGLVIYWFLRIFFAKKINLHE